MATLALQHCWKTFDDGSTALEDFSLNVHDGELMVLVGPSGCGKSTTLRLLAGLDSPSRGDIVIDGKVINELTPQQRNVAMIFQNYALYPHMTVRNNLAFPLKMLKLEKPLIDNRVGEIAEMLQLTELLARKPSQLSGGQRQRVAMGRALVRKPKVFLMDEPLSNLDAKLRVQIRAEIADLQRKLGITTLYVTHDQSEALTLGDRIAVVNKGRIQQVGKPDELYHYPMNTFVADFIGTPGMNIVPANLQRQQASDSLTLKIGRYELVLNPENQATFDAFTDQGVFVGIRPEHIKPSDQPSALPVKIVNIESLGHESLVYFNADWTDNQTLAMRTTNPVTIDIGTTRAEFDLQNIHLFDADGQRCE